MGIIGLSPNNLISPIDFVPGLGPLNKLRKGYRAAKAAKKSGYLGSKFNTGRKWFWTTAGTLDALGEIYIYRAFYQNRESIGEALSDVADFRPTVIGGGPMFHHRGLLEQHT